MDGHFQCVQAVAWAQHFSGLCSQYLLMDTTIQRPSLPPNTMRSDRVFRNHFRTRYLYHVCSPCHKARYMNDKGCKMRASSVDVPSRELYRARLNFASRNMTDSKCGVCIRKRCKPLSTPPSTEIETPSLAWVKLVYSTRQHIRLSTSTDVTWM